MELEKKKNELPINAMRMNLQQITYERLVGGGVGHEPKTRYDIPMFPCLQDAKRQIYIEIRLIVAWTGGGKRGHEGH